MTLYTFPTAGGVISNATTRINENYNRSLSQTARNMIRQLQDRSIDLDGRGGEFVETFIDVSGRLNSVDSSNTTARYDDTNLSFYCGVTDESSGDTTSDPDSFTNASNAFDGDDATTATKTISYSGGGTYTVSLGKTFSAKTVDQVVVKARWNSYSADSGFIRIETYNGSVWSTLKQVSVGNDEIRYIVADSSSAGSIQGLRVFFSITKGGSSPAGVPTLYFLEYGDQTTSQVSITIPSGSYSSTITSAFSDVLTEFWESGAALDYKLLNTGGDDSGWLTVGTIGSFTAFSNGEPDELLVRLTPKSSSPTALYPSIKGVACFE